MKNLFLSVLLLYSLTVVAQNTFNHRLNFGFPVAVTTGVIATDSCYYLSGIIADTVFPYKTGNIFLKLDLYGEIERLNWLADTNKTYETWNQSFLSLNNGGFVHCGYSIDTSLFNMVIKFNELGEYDEIILFDKFFGEDLFSAPKALAVDENDGLLVGSEQVNTIGTNNSEIVLTRIDANGNIIWEQFYGTPINERPNEIISLSPDLFIISGRRNNTNLVDQGYVSRDYIFAVDSLGQMLWQYSSPAWQLRSGAKSIVALEDGSLVIATQLGEEFYINQGRSGLKWGNGLIYKLSPDKEIEWEVEFTEPTPNIILNEVNKLIAVSDGSGYVATGQYVDFELGVVEDINGWIFKVSPDGDSLWSRKLRFWEEPGPSHWHFLYDIAEAPDGGFIMVGQVEHIYATTPPRQQAWIIKVDEHGCLVPGCQLVGTEEQQNLPQSRLLLHPSPATEYLNVFLKDDRISRRKRPQLRILSMEGKVLETYNIDPQDEVTHMIAVRQLPAGMYVLQYWAGEGILASEKFSKVE